MLKDLILDKETDGSCDECIAHCRYTITDKGRVWIKHIQDIPFPEVTYVIPGKVE